MPKLRWRAKHYAWDDGRAAIIQTLYPDRRGDSNGWLEWYEVDYNAHSGQDPGSVAFAFSEGWYARYYRSDKNSCVFLERRELGNGLSTIEDAKAACQAHYNSRQTGRAVITRDSGDG